jgi:hypothetical protein
VTKRTIIQNIPGAKLTIITGETLDEKAKVRMMANPNTIMEIVISRVRNSTNNSFFKSVKNITGFP